MVRRAQKNQVPEPAWPVHALGRRAVAGTACHQAAHAVGQQGQGLDLLRPGLQQQFEQRRQLPAIDRGVQAGVVVQVNRGVAKLVCEPLPVVLAVARQRIRRAVSAPLQVVHAQAMHQQQNLACRMGQVLRQRGLVHGQGLAVMAQAHADGQRIGGVQQLVTEHAVKRRQQGFALRR